jgi:hypothetical protein
VKRTLFMFGTGNGTRIDHGSKGRNKETGAPVRSKFDNDMTPHVWAQANQTFGQNSNGTIYFYGRALYSYRNTAPIGWIMPDGRTALISCDSYSITTSRHQGGARQATRGASYLVPDLDDLLRNAARPPCSGDIDACERFESGIDSALSDKAHIRRFVADRIARDDKSLSESAARFLLSNCGLSRSFDKIQRDAFAARDKAKAKARAEQQKQAIGRLEHTAALYRRGRAAMIESLTNSLGQYELTNPAAPAAKIETVQKAIRASRSQAGKAKTPPAIWRDAWLAHELLPDLATDLAAAFQARARALSLADRREARRRLIRAFRLSHSENFGTKIESDMHPYHVASAIVRACERKGTAARNLANHLRAACPEFGPLAAIAVRLDQMADGLAAFNKAAREGETLPRLGAEYAAQEQERKERERAEREAAELQARADWLAGKAGAYRPYFARGNGAAYIRAVDVTRNLAGMITGGTLETSQGANVPLVAAIRAFRFIKLVIASGKAWHRNGARVPVGSFQIDTIQPNGDFIAGCHKFDWLDVQALALSLDVADLAPDDSALVRAARAA